MWYYTHFTIHVFTIHVFTIHVFTVHVLPFTFYHTLFLCLCDLLSPLCECVCKRFYCKLCCDSRVVIFEWTFDHFL